MDGHQEDYGGMRGAGRMEEHFRSKEVGGAGSLEGH